MINYGVIHTAFYLIKGQSLHFYLLLLKPYVGKGNDTFYILMCHKRKNISIIEDGINK
jgi:hypothetical protein